VTPLVASIDSKVVCPKAVPTAFVSIHGEYVDPSSALSILSSAAKISSDSKGDKLQAANRPSSAAMVDPLSAPVLARLSGGSEQVRVEEQEHQQGAGANGSEAGDTKSGRDGGECRRSLPLVLVVTAEY
jgi:hypothetical protein